MQFIQDKWFYQRHHSKKCARCGAADTCPYSDPNFEKNAKPHEIASANLKVGSFFYSWALHANVMGNFSFKNLTPDSKWSKVLKFIAQHPGSIRKDIVDNMFLNSSVSKTSIDDAITRLWRSLCIGKDEHKHYYITALGEDLLKEFNL